MKAIRWILGRIILFVDALTRPSPMKRPDSMQRIIDEQTKALTLYQYEACPFCVKVRRVMRKLNLRIALVDAKNNETAREELIKRGGKKQVPCLRIQSPDGNVEWMYESDAIIEYLNHLYGKEKGPQAA